MMASKLALLDRTLFRYGPPANDARAALRSSVAQMLNQGWPQDRLQAPNLEPRTGGEIIFNKIQELALDNDTQRAAKAEAISIVVSLGELRWLAASTIRSSTSVPLLIVEIAWATIAFVSFENSAPRNFTVVLFSFMHGPWRRDSS